MQIEEARGPLESGFLEIGATLSQEELSNNAFSCCVLLKYERHTDRPKTFPHGKTSIVAKNGKNYDTTSDFTTANPPLMLVPSNPDHFNNIHKTPPPLCYGCDARGMQAPLWAD